MSAGPDQKPAVLFSEDLMLLPHSYGYSNLKKERNMKSKKILAAALVLMLVLGLAACSTGSAQDAPGAPDCFVVEETPVYSNVSTLEGELVSSYDELNLVALMTDSYDLHYGSKKVVTVYDLNTGSAVCSTEGMYFDWYNIVNFNFSIEHYPLAVISYDQSLTDELGNEYYERYYSYYLMNGAFTAIAENVAADSLRTGKVGNINLYGIDNTLYWVSNDGKILRRSPIAVSDTYADIEDLDNYLDIDAEYNGFIYCWEFTQTSRTVQIYNPSGVCTAQYKLPQDAILLNTDSIINPNVFVLNNGNLILQYVTEAAADAESWDIMDNIIGTSMHFDVHTLKINKDSGEVTELDLDYVITALESSYGRKGNGYSSNFSLELTDDYANQAYIVHFANGYLSEKLEYVIFDDELTQKYVFPNDYLAYMGRYYVYSPSSIGYLAYAIIDGKQEAALFYWDGTLKAELSDAAYENALIAKDHYVTPSGVYDLEGNLKFDLVKNGFVTDFNYLSDEVYTVLGSNIYLKKYNASTGAVEVYALDTSDWSTTLIVDGIDVQTASVGEGYYKVKNIETGVSSLYNSKNEIILKVYGDMHLYEANRVAYVTVNVDGEFLLYVIKAK